MNLLRDGKRWVRFYINSMMKSTLWITSASPVLARRTIVSSNGASNIRYIIQTQVAIAGQTWPIEVSLNNHW